MTRVSHDPVCAPGELLQLVRAGLRNPVKVEVKVRLLHAGGGVGQSGDGSAAASGPRKTSATPSSLSLFYMLCEEEQRLPQLLHFLGGRLATGQKIMCYFLTCAQARNAHGWGPWSEPRHTPHSCCLLRAPSCCLLLEYSF